MAHLMHKLFSLQAYKIVLKYESVYSIPLVIVVLVLSCVPLFVTPRTVTCQGPLSMGFSRQEY